MLIERRSLAVLSPPQLGRELGERGGGGRSHEVKQLRQLYQERSDDWVSQNLLNSQPQ
jgi:hypothetical protein